MSDTVLKIKYQCQHPSCQVYCKKGTLELDKELYKELDDFHAEEGIFKSPRELCKMGFSQPLKVVSMEEVAADIEARGEAEAAAAADDPIEQLKREHKGVLEKLDIIDGHVRKRDIEGLWGATAAVENDIMLHSIKKEEGLLFPLLKNRIPMGDAYMQIMHEDHKEFISLLHSFRCALQEDEILDGIISSIVVNLRNHIKKEDDEFFRMVSEALEEDEKKKLFAEMEKVSAEHVDIEAGNRAEKIVSPYLENRKMLNAEIAHAKKEGTTDDWSCH